MIAVCGRNGRGVLLDVVDLESDDDQEIKISRLEHTVLKLVRFWRDFDLLSGKQQGSRETRDFTDEIHIHLKRTFRSGHSCFKYQ